MVPEDMKAEGVPWGEPPKAVPLAGVKKVSELMREHSVPIDSPGAWPRSQMTAVPWWRRVMAKLWPQNRVRPRVIFERDYGNNALMINLHVGRHAGLGCYAFGRGVRIGFEHGPDCGCDDCIPF